MHSSLYIYVAVLVLALRLVVVSVSQGDASMNEKILIRILFWFEGGDIELYVTGGVTELITCITRVVVETNRLARKNAARVVKKTQKVKRLVKNKWLFMSRV